MFRWMFLLISLIPLTACDSPTDSERSATPIVATQAAEKSVAPVFEPLTATKLLKEPTPVHGFETTAEAFSVWRRATSERPTLLLISNNPHLKMVPEELRKTALILANNANLETLRLGTTDRAPSPLILPGMAVDIALRSGWFREIAWALPLRDPAQELDLEKFTSQLTETALASEEEVKSITLTERVFDGTLRNTPFRAAALPLIKNLSGPVIVHIDLSYFQPIYKNEISTPLLDTIHQTLLTLQKMHLETLAVTFSYGHLDSQIALDVRFLGEIIPTLIEDPQKLEQDIPLNWQRQRDALYLANFFQKDKIRELYEAQEKDAPDTGWVKFNLYRSAAEHKEGTKALDYLAEAVALDSMYALEYQELSDMAYEKQRPDETLRMLVLEAEVFHTDPFIKLQMAQLANELGEKEKSLELLNKIRNLEWSEVYYPQMPQYIADLTSYVQTGQGPEQSPKGGKLEKGETVELVIPEPETTRKRVMHSK